MPGRGKGVIATTERSMRWKGNHKKEAGKDRKDLEGGKGQECME